LAHQSCDGDCGGDRNCAAGPPLEQQKLDRQQNGSQRGIEGGRHSAGGAGNEQDLAFIGGQVQMLGEDRT
jgi:hypothetical protein